MHLIATSFGVLPVRQSSRNGRRAFTLIELLIVIAIILILIAIALPNFLEAQIRSRVTRANAEMRSLITATAAYRNIYNRAPDPQNVITSSDFDRNWWGFASNKL